MLPLHVAAGMGHTGAVEVLLSARAALDAKDAAHRGAVHSAAEAGHIATLRVLADKGADITAKDVQRQGPLDLARAHGHAAVAAFLKHGRHGRKKLLGTPELRSVATEL